LVNSAIFRSFFAIFPIFFVAPLLLRKRLNTIFRSFFIFFGIFSVAPPWKIFLSTPLRVGGMGGGQKHTGLKAGTSYLKSKQFESLTERSFEASCFITLFVFYIPLQIVEQNKVTVTIIDTSSKMGQKI